MVIINHFGVRNNDDDSDNDQDGHPIQQSMATKMAIMNRNNPATMIDSSSSIEWYTKYDDNVATITAS